MKTAYDVLKEKELITREVLAADVNGKVVDLTTEVEEGAEVAPVTLRPLREKRFSGIPRLTFLHRR